MKLPHTHTTNRVAIFDISLGITEENKSMNKIISSTSFYDVTHYLILDQGYTLNRNV